MDDPQRALKQWLAEKVAERGEAQRLGAAIGLSGDKITRSKELDSPDPKKRRALKYEEIRAIAMYYRELPPGYEGMKQWLRDADATMAPKRPVVSSFDPDKPDEGESDPDWDGRGAGVVDGRLAFSPQWPGGMPEIAARAGAGIGAIDDERAVKISARGIASGHPVLNEWVVPSGYVRNGLGARPSEVIILPVVGHSMEPMLKANDRVLVDTSQNVWMGDAVYVIDDGDSVLRVKTVKKVTSSTPPRYLIISEATPDAFETLDVDQFHIVGRVVGRFTQM